MLRFENPRQSSDSAIITTERKSVRKSKETINFNSSLRRTLTSSHDQGGGLPPLERKFSMTEKLPPVPKRTKKNSIKISEQVSEQE